MSNVWVCSIIGFGGAILIFALIFCWMYRAMKSYQDHGEIDKIREESTELNYDFGEEAKS